MNHSRHDPEHDPREDAELQALARLFRDHSPSDPPADAWQRTFARIEAAVGKGVPPRRSWPTYLLVGLAAAAAALVAGVMVAQERWPILAGTAEPKVVAVAPKPKEPTEDDEPFPVALASEVHILSVNPNEADRLVMQGPPVLGAFEFAFAEDIEIVGVEPSPEQKKCRKPIVQVSKGAPMVIVVPADDEDDEQP